jgi:pyruvate dehydrogenase E2 component (dihydrolipoamide acetyltransferase)
MLNASWSGNGIRHNQEINIGLAVAVEDGVISAVIRNADTLGLSEIANQRKELAERAHSGKLRPADVNNGTFTISNLGMYNVDSFQAIITPPQVAILAVGKIVDRVVAVDAQPAVRPIMTMTLSCDHRVVDGAKAALFLDDLADAIGDPEDLLN